MTLQVSKEELLDRIEKSAHDYEARYRGCSRCVMKSLLEHLKLGDGAVFRAATPLAAGIAMRGETCGALIAGMMALGLVLASEDIEDEPRWMEAMRASYRLWRRFEEEIGDTSCRQIQIVRLGRAYNLADIEEYEEFIKAGACEVCSTVVGKAARLAAQMILEQSEKMD